MKYEGKAFTDYPLLDFVSFFDFVMNSKVEQILQHVGCFMFRGHLNYNSEMEYDSADFRYSVLKEYFNYVTRKFNREYITNNIVSGDDLSVWSESEIDYIEDNYNIYTLNDFILSTNNMYIKLYIKDNNDSLYR